MSLCEMQNFDGGVFDSTMPSENIVKGEFSLGDESATSESGTVEVVHRVSMRNISKGYRKMSLCEMQDFDGGIFDSTIPSATLVNGVVNPNSGAKLMWDLGVILMVLFDAIVVPYTLAFNADGSTSFFDTSWLAFTTALFGFDILVSFFTGVIKGTNSVRTPAGLLVTNRVSIAKAYLSGWFLLDLASTIPWGMFAELASGGSGGAAEMGRSARLVKLFRFLRLMRLARLAKLWALWETVEAHLGSAYLRLSLSMCSQAFRLALFCHWNACVWWMIGDPNSIFAVDYKDHWTSQVPTGGGLPMIQRSTIEQYVFSFYWTLGVMRTMPAEIMPTNLVERLYLMFFMFVAFSLFAICIAQITSTYFKFSARAKNYEEEQSNARAYMRSISLDKRVQDAVNNYFKAQYDNGRIGTQTHNLISSLPDVLNRQVKFCRLRVHLYKANALRGHPNESHLLMYVCQASKVDFHPPGGVLSVAGRAAEAAHIRISGCLKIKMPRMKNDIFEDLGGRGTVEVVDEHCLNLSRKSPRSEFTVVVTYCAEVITIGRDDFEHIVSKHEEFWAGFNYSRAVTDNDEGSSISPAETPFQDDDPNIAAAASIMVS